MPEHCWGCCCTRLDTQSLYLEACCVLRRLLAEHILGCWARSVQCIWSACRADPDFMVYAVELVVRWRWRGNALSYHFGSAVLRAGLQMHPQPAHLLLPLQQLLAGKMLSLYQQQQHTMQFACSFSSSTGSTHSLCCGSHLCGESGAQAGQIRGTGRCALVSWPLRCTHCLCN